MVNTLCWGMVKGAWDEASVSIGTLYRWLGFSGRMRTLDLRLTTGASRSATTGAPHAASALTGHALSLHSPLHLDLVMVRALLSALVLTPHAMDSALLYNTWKWPRPNTASRGSVSGRGDWL